MDRELQPLGRRQPAAKTMLALKKMRERLTKPDDVLEYGELGAAINGNPQNGDSCFVRSARKMFEAENAARDCIVGVVPNVGLKWLSVNERAVLGTQLRKATTRKATRALAVLSSTVGHDSELTKEALSARDIAMLQVSIQETAGKATTYKKLAAAMDKSGKLLGFGEALRLL